MNRRGTTHFFQNIFFIQRGTTQCFTHHFYYYSLFHACSGKEKKIQLKYMYINKFE